MNIHPLFVHFPIGILTLYTFFEIARVRYITKQPFYFELKAVLVIFGTLAGYVAATTGDMAEELAGAGQNSVASVAQVPLIETHALFAISTVTIFSFLAGSYLFEYLKKKHALKILTSIGFFQRLSKYIQKSSFYLAVIGFVVMTITGGLGASIVYGPDFDPMVKIIYSIFAP